MISAAVFVFKETSLVCFASSQQGVLVFELGVILFRVRLFSLNFYVSPVIDVSVSLYIVKMCMSRELETLNWPVDMFPYFCDRLGI